MNPVRFWFAVFAILAFVLTGPAWLYFSGAAADGLPTEIQWLVALFLPVALLLTLASWVQPG